MYNIQFIIISDKKRSKLFDIIFRANKTLKKIRYPAVSNFFDISNGILYFKKKFTLFFEFFGGFLKISSFWNIICPMPWSKKGFVALFQYKIRRVLNTGFTDIHVQDDFRYLFGASGKISLPLAAIFCRVSATLHIHISTWISLCVPNTFLHVKRMRNLKQYIKSNFQNL